LGECRVLLCESRGGREERADEEEEEEEILHEREWK
jgi:hypothetical protein